MFISFEGTDASRTSAQTSKIIEGVEKYGYPTTIVRTFSASPVGDVIRDILKTDRFIRFNFKYSTRYSELFLVLCDFALRAETIILPALERGDVVLSDRYIDSPVAFQVQMLRQQYSQLDQDQTLLAWSNFLYRTFPLLPDLTLLFDISEEESFRRVQSRDNVTMTKEEKDVISGSIKTFRWLAEHYPQRFFVIDAELPPDEIIETATSVIIKRINSTFQ